VHRAKHYADLRRRPQPRWIEIGKHQPPWWWRRITGLIERGAEPGVPLHAPAGRPLTEPAG